MSEQAMRRVRSHPGLRALRLANGLSQDELGFRAGISQARLSRAERGYLCLREDERHRVATALGAKVTDLERRDSPATTRRT